MIVYKVFYKNYELKQGEYISVLIERRRSLRGMTQAESGLRWSKLTFDHLVEDKHAIFVVPKELKFSIDTRWLMEKGVFTKEELLGMVNVVVPEIKREASL